MVLSAVAVLNVGSPALSASTECEPDGGGGGGGESPTPSGSASPSPSTSSPAPFPPTLPPILPTASSSSPSPTASDTGGGGARKCDSEITIKYQRPNLERPGRDKFYGNVRSDEEACEGGRQVIVKRAKAGRDATFDRTVTNNRGRWTVPGKGAKKGRYYAKTPEERVASDQGRVTCGADRSRSVRV